MKGQYLCDCFAALTPGKRIMVVGVLLASTTLFFPRWERRWREDRDYRLPDQEQMDVVRAFLITGPSGPEYQYNGKLYRRSTTSHIILGDAIFCWLAVATPSVLIGFLFDRRADGMQNRQV